MPDVKVMIDHLGCGSISVNGVDLSAITNGVTIRSKVGELTSIQLDVPAVAIDGQMQVCLNKLGIRPKESLPWTADKPTVPGWYWYHDKDQYPGVREIVRVRWWIGWDAPNDHSDQLRCYKMAVDLDYELYQLNGQWAGPLEVPDDTA